MQEGDSLWAFLARGARHALLLWTEMWDKLNEQEQQANEAWVSDNLHKVVTFAPDKWWVAAHGEIALWLCFSKSGKLLATCGHDRTAVIWRLESSTRAYTRLEVRTVAVFAVQM
jgi:WD40 repeat protein